MTSTALPIAILAGGLATRMQPLTTTVPKALLPVAGKPFIRRQLELLRQHGAQRIVLCLGHLGEQIEHEIGDGSTLGLSVAYVYDGPKLLGTGGALRRALPQLGEEFFVLYGDSYLPIDLAPVEATFRQSGKRGLMTVYRNEGLYDTSNIWFENGQIRAYDKKQRDTRMHHIDYGLGVLTRAAFDGFPTTGPFDLAEVYRRLLAHEQLAAFESPTRFYEIGSAAGLAELDEFLKHSTTPHSQ
ncbi:MAG: nucleotidyl transferase [Verrucomicrobia bacterium Tous-C9LFEB]|nr:MAG: nucleotidyl transferase [Verrucomicrobia bacterium Tous-C9LFEB]